VVRIYGDADARPCHKGLIVRHHWNCEGRENTSGGISGGFRSGAGQEDDEFVAAEPRRRIDRAHYPTQLAGDQVQECIAATMPERIISLLEVIEIEKKEGHGGLLTPRDGEGVIHAVVEQGAIGQAGQVIVERAMRPVSTLRDERPSECRHATLGAPGGSPRYDKDDKGGRKL